MAPAGRTGRDHANAQGDGRLWSLSPGTVVLFDNASHKLTAKPASRVADSLLSTLEDAGWEATRIDAHQRGVKEALAEFDAIEADLIIALGGDGTVAACADAAMRARAALLPVPGGTMNLTAKDLGASDANDRLVDRYMMGTAATIDTAEINGHTFLHSVATGLVPAIGAQREAFRSRRNVVARGAALAAAGRIALCHRPAAMRMQTDKGITETWSLCVVASNNRLHRHHDIGFGRASLDAGTIGLYMSTHKGLLGRFVLMQTLITGQLELDRSFRAASVEEISIDSDAPTVAVSVDGEILSLEPPIVITQKRSALRVIIPGPSPDAGA
ncbi:MAG: diacylglycerol kinase family protein [Planctomycetota bacterium]